MDILGKSNQTLLGHTRDCLIICDELLRRREPFLRDFCQRYNWDSEEVRRCIRFAVWFHDIGKASDQWQSYIRKSEGQQWKHRITHALPSFAIGAISLGIRGVEKSPRLAALLAILAHHVQMLHNSSFPEERHRCIVDMPVAYLREHLEYFRECEPNFSIAYPQTPQIDLGKACKIVEAVKYAVYKERDLSFKALYSLILNILTASDTYASKYGPKEGSPHAPSDKNLTLNQLLLINDEFPFYNTTSLKLLSFLPEGEKRNKMQQDIVASDSDRLILNAGCGEGKTAAALLFAQKLLKNNQIERIIFTLPTKFTANNLYRDLVSPEGYDIPQKLVGIIHGDSKEFLTQLTKEEETHSEIERTNANLIAQEFENNFYAKPVTISTIDHLLMSLYHGYKYADRAFFNVASSVVIFDEVHYYQGITTAAIAEAMQHLTRLKVPHLVMTATIPTAVRARFNKLSRGHPYPFLRATAAVSDTSKPKTPFEIVKLQDTPIDADDNTSAELVGLVKENTGKRQIIFVNQVNRAKNVYLALKERRICENLICYHSGFISKDRVQKEKVIRSLFKAPSQRKDEEIKVLEKYSFNNSEACVLVSTQVSEISLDISADVMYSEIAPIDSIVQRGGRLNRKGVLPFDEQRGHTYRLYLMPAYENERACLPYEPDILQKSWDAIGDLYTFDDACMWVDAVYPEHPPLMHKELSDAIGYDLIFGKRPQENFAEENDAEGRVVIREQRYQTYDVVPVKFRGRVIKDYREFKRHNLSISAGGYRKAEMENQIERQEAILEIHTHGKQEKRISRIPFTTIDKDYTFEIGLKTD